MNTDIHHRKRCVRHNLPGHAHELTFSCFKRRKLLTSDRTCRYLADAVIRARIKHEFDVWAYVFMPNHVHLLIFPKSEIYSVSDILTSVKQPVARRAVAYLRKSNHAGLKHLASGSKQTPYRFWMEGGGYDRNVTEERTLEKMIEYIHNNPVRRGLVNIPTEWKWSSAGFWLEGVEGVIPVDRPSFLM